MTKEEKLLRKQLRDEEIKFSEIPEEYRKNINVIKQARTLEICEPVSFGYDVIKQMFFVEDEIYCSRSEFLFFETLEQVITYLDGNIPKDICFYKCKLNEEEQTLLRDNGINIKTINKQNSLINVHIDDLDFMYTGKFADQPPDPIESKENYKKTFKLIDEIKEDNKTPEQIKKTILKKIDNLREHGVSPYPFYQLLIENDPDNEYIVDMFLGKLKGGRDAYLAEFLSYFYGYNEIKDKYKVTIYSEQVNKKYMREVRKHLEYIENNQKEWVLESGFNARNKSFYLSKNMVVDDGTKTEIILSLTKYYRTFDDLIHELNGSLENCDLSKWEECNIDISKYKTNKNTQLPYWYYDDFEIKKKSYYDHYQDLFIVKVKASCNGKYIYTNDFEFNLFADFAYFLNYDIQNSDLIMCEGLSNISDFTDLQLDGALLPQRVRLKLGYDNQSLTIIKQSDDFALKNENETMMVNGSIDMELQEQRRKDLVLDPINIVSSEYGVIHYITDLHLMHYLSNRNVDNKNDAMQKLQILADKLVLNTKEILLIGGDVTNNKDIFKAFLYCLNKARQQNCIKIIFCLGNHDLAAFENQQTSEIVDWYKQTIESYFGMYLLHNSVLYREDYYDIKEIKENNLLNLSKEELQYQLRKAKTVFFGGVGFSGYNTKYNADTILYHNTFTREEDIRQTKLFETLYQKICASIPKKDVIILTHMPIEDWNSNNMILSNFVYVNGHTHRNTFYDDGGIRIYADNQFGYNKGKIIEPHVNYFHVDFKCDVFENYEDGIYEITKEDYIDFYHGKNIMMQFGRECEQLYMLKKNGYYMFIHSTNNGSLTILNGAARKKLPKNSIQFYYDNMDFMIETIAGPLEKYYNYQKQISYCIQRLGGDGLVHGAIIDIDFYNHIFVDPNDLTVTPYFATDIVNKQIYKNIPSLLKAQQPLMFDRYIKMLDGSGSENGIILLSNLPDINVQSKSCLSTDIYYSSRIIKKMQKTFSNILPIWEDSVIEKRKEIQQKESKKNNKKRKNNYNNI